MGEGPRQIVLLGHIDTVPGEISVRIEGDVLYGRGSVDAKGPLATFVDAVAQVGARPGWQFVVVGAVDEEGDSKGAWHLTERYRPEVAIVGEPNHWQRIALGYRGGLWFEYEVRRAISHTASGKESACEVAVRFWNRLKAACDEYNQGRTLVFDQLFAGLRRMHSENDGFEECARLFINVRLPLTVSPEEMQARLEALREEGTLRLSGLPVPAYRADKNTPLVRAMLAAIRANGGQPSFVLKSGTADLNTVAPFWKCPMVVYGPGDSSLDHTPDEQLSLSEYRQAVQVMAHALGILTR
jgi:LysW-gamma-L-lysine carboxypeptidase